MYERKQIIGKYIELVRKNLSNDLRKKEYQQNPNPMAGHCYVASEALFFLLGGKQAGLKPMRIQHEKSMHWFLLDYDGTIIDATSDQFQTPVPYEKGIGNGFLTKQPSKRAKTLLSKIMAGGAN
jgi:hypothetical protein